ncbi:TPA: hypothetical protein KDY05_001969 [Vibrio parahaemolyticus]|nr:hypothetical protein [Vibrio parahaemolyticus]
MMTKQGLTVFVQDFPTDQKVIGQALITNAHLRVWVDKSRYGAYMLLIPLVQGESVETVYFNTPDYKKSWCTAPGDVGNINALIDALNSDDDVIEFTYRENGSDWTVTIELDSYDNQMPIPNYQHSDITDAVMLTH